MTPYWMDDARRACPGMRCMLEIGECTGMCAMVALRDLSQRLVENHSVYNLSQGIWHEPSKIVTNEQLVLPRTFGAPQHKALCIIIDIIFRSDTQELADERSMPCIIVFYVFVQMTIDSTERK